MKLSDLSWIVLAGSIILSQDSVSPLTTEKKTYQTNPISACDLVDNYSLDTQKPEMKDHGGLRDRLRENCLKREKEKRELQEYKNAFKCFQEFYGRGICS